MTEEKDRRGKKENIGVGIALGIDRHKVMSYAENCECIEKYIDRIFVFQDQICLSQLHRFFSGHSPYCICRVNIVDYG